MAQDTVKPAPPPGTLPAALTLVAGAVGGAVLAVRHDSVEHLVLGIILFACASFLGVGLLYAWFKGRKQT